MHRWPKTYLDEVAEKVMRMMDDGDGGDDAVRYLL